MSKAIILFFTISSIVAAGVSAQNDNQDARHDVRWIDFNKNGVKNIYEDSSRTLEERVEDLLSQMTLDEKTCQMVTLYGYGRVLPDALPQEGWKDELWKDGIGAIDEHLNGFVGWNRPLKENDLIWPASRHAWAMNEVQRWFVEETRLGIPVDFTNEGIRGVEAYKATNFPAPIGMGHTWNRNLIYRIGEITGKEARALGYTNIYAPILDVGRDQRWGRYEEIFGESPFLVAELGIAMTRGLQKDFQVAATGKHYVAYSNNKGAREGGSRVDPQMSLREVENVHVYPWRKVIKEANLLGVMSSYNDYDGVPIQGSQYWLNTKLRGELGFKGYVVSDSDAVIYMYNKHRTAKTYKDAIKAAVNAGLNVRCTFRSPSGYVVPLRELIESGEISLDTIDNRVREILRVKFLIGLFDTPYVQDVEAADKIVYSLQNREVALTAARESIVLLKNEGDLLPLNRTEFEKIAVIGPMADDASYSFAHYGPLTGESTSVLEGIKNKIGADTEVLYAKGCDVVDENWPESEIIDFPLSSHERNAISEAVDVSNKADVVIVVVGGNGKTSGENKSRTSLDLPGRQRDLLKAVYATGKPLVVVQISGRPLSINWCEQNIPAILSAWYPGAEGGIAIADVLFGDYNPGGKLTVTVPKTVGQIPINFPYKPSSQIPDGTAGVNDPLYSFGYGLSYTTFEYGELQILPKVLTPEDGVYVTFSLTNTGEITGEEVVQLYVRDMVSSVTTYDLSLRGFDRVKLMPGEKRTISFHLSPEDLQLLNSDHEWVVEPGKFTVFIGASSNDIRLNDSFIVTDVEHFEVAKMELQQETQIDLHVHPSTGPSNKNLLFDGSLESTWSALGKNVYIDFELMKEAVPQEVGISWYKGDSRSYHFEIQLSCGGGQFVPVYQGKSSGKSNEIEKYTFEGCVASDMRIMFFGNDENEWNAVSEIELTVLKK